MSKLMQLAAGTALAITVAMPAAAQDADTVVATVNGTDITLGHMLVLRERLPEQYQQLPDDQLYQGILEQLIQQTALGDKVDGLDKRGELVMDNERRALMAGAVITEAAEGAVTDEALQQAYDAAYAEAEPTPEWNASHILVETEDEARAIIEEVNGGADFAEVAKEKSTGPSGPSGGELGWFGAGMMVEPFETAVTGMEAGEISEPVQTQFGWHVIKLNDTRQKEAPSLDEVREELSAQIQQEAVQAMIAETVAQADVQRPETEIDPSALSDASLLSDR